MDLFGLEDENKLILALSCIIVQPTFHSHSQQPITNCTFVGVCSELSCADGPMRTT
jgi:hypothetical protein